MANLRKPHEQDVLLSAVERTFVGYFGTTGQIGAGIPVHERPAEPPIGTIYEQEYVLYQDIELEDGSVLREQQLQPEKIVPKTFLRGRVVTDKNEVMTLLMPSILRGLVSVLEARLELKWCSARAAVAVKKADGTEVGIPLHSDDVPPPATTSDYAVGESPEERRMAEMVQETTADDEADELEAIRQDAKDGVYDEEEEEAAVGGGHPVIPFAGRDDGGPRAA